MADLYLVDGNNVLYRSFFAIPSLTTSAGQPTNALYGFAAVLLKLLRSHHPSHLAVAFDVKGPTFRHELFAGYKAHRQPMPEELAQQIEPSRELVRVLALPLLQRQGYEADDLIAAVAVSAAARGHRVRIVSGDKDLLQLIDGRISLVNPADGALRDEAWFAETYGFPPPRIAEYLALTGDASDNIPGVRGIGPKTAAKLVRDFGTLEAIYGRLDEVRPPGVRARLEAGREAAMESRKLILLRRDAPGLPPFEEFAVGKASFPAVRTFLERYECRRLVPAAATVFGRGETAPGGLEDLVSFSPGGEEASFAAILADPEPFRARLEDAAVAKSGFNLKEKAVALHGAGIAAKGLAFDAAVARYLAGRSSASPALADAIRDYRAMLRQDGLADLFNRVEMPLVEVLLAMEIAGIAVDTASLDRLREALASELAALEVRIHEAAGEVFNINSSRQLATVLFERLGLPGRRRTKSGYSTDSSVLEELAGRHPLPRLVLEYRSVFKLISTYVDGLPPFINPATGRIHPTFNQMVAATGRLSCSNPNLQNLPVRSERGGLVRKAFRPAPGNVFFSFDYSQIELRILAHLSGDPGLAEAFRRDRDIHAETAERLFSSGALFTGAPTDLRRLAKTINFGIIYGMSPFGLSRQLGIPAEDARAFIETYFREFPGVRAYLDRVVADAERAGFVTTLLGRRRPVPELRSAERAQKESGRRVAVNMPIQGLAADMIKIAMVTVHRELSRRGPRTRLVLQIHDELLFDADPGDGTWLVPFVRDAMASAVPLAVPVKVDVRRGPDYLDLEAAE